MIIRINNKEVDTSAGTLLQLANELMLPEKGIAIAINNKMIPRPEWNALSLSENDNIIIIKAACGG